jgi:hypothetical protein
MSKDGIVVSALPGFLGYRRCPLVVIYMCVLLRQSWMSWIHDLWHSNHESMQLLPHINLKPWF